MLRFVAIGSVTGFQMAQNMKGNVFGTFLETMNIGKDSRNLQFDLEASAKKALQILSEDRNIIDARELGMRLGVDDTQLNQVLTMLTQAGMLAQIKDGTITLTPFGRDALDTFAVA